MHESTLVRHKTISWCILGLISLYFIDCLIRRARQNSTKTLMMILGDPGHHQIIPPRDGGPIKCTKSLRLEEKSFYLHREGVGVILSLFISVCWLREDCGSVARVMHDLGLKPILLRQRGLARGLGGHTEKLATIRRPKRKLIRYLAEIMLLTLLSQNG